MVAGAELGTEAYVYTGGKPFDASRPCVVFIHGALHDHSVWTLLARSFASHGCAVLAPDLPGHGKSGGAPLASVEAMAEWVLALLDAAGVAQAALVGHSMGSLVALEAASRAPGRISRLVMVATAYPMVVSEKLLVTAATVPNDAIDLINSLSFASMAAKPSYLGPGTWLHGANRALCRRLQAAQTATNLFVRDFTACHEYAHGLGAARAVTCPTTLLLGTEDRMTLPSAAQPLIDAMKPSVVRLRAGHSLMAEAPDAVLAALTAALL